MNTNDLKSIWNTYDAKLEKSLKLNLQGIETIQSQKFKSPYTSLKIFKTIEIVVGVMFIFFLGNFLYKNLNEIYYVIAAAILMVFCILAVIGSVSQIVLVTRLNYNENLVDSQKKLALLQSSVLLQSLIIKYLRIAILSLPFYTAYIIIGCKIIFNINIVTQGDKYWWLSQIFISILFIPLSIRLYNKISYKNIHIKWVRKLIESVGGGSVTKAMEFINEIDEFKNN